MRFKLRITPLQWLICFVGFTEAIIYGYSFPYFSLVLESRNASNVMIGINAMIGTLGALVVGPFVPKLIVKFGYRHFSATAMMIVSMIFVAILIHDSTCALFCYRLILGFALASLWISTEAWLNHVLDDSNRGFMNGFFQTGYSFGFFLGPLIAAYTNIDGSTGPALAAIIAVVSFIVCLSFLSSTTKTIGEKGFESPLDWSMAWSARGLLFVAMLTGVAETALYTLLPVYGLEIGLGYQTAVALLVVYTFGEVILTLPLGWTADRINRRKMLAGCAFVASACVGFLSFAGVIGYGAWFFSFIAGGTVVGLYNLVLVIVGETYRDTDLPIVSTAFAMSYGIGCAIGSTFGGISMDIFGPYGLPTSISIVLALFGVGVMFTFLNRGLSE